MSDELLNKALDLAYFYLKFRPRTKKELTGYLYRKSKKYHFSEKLINQSIKRLTELNLVNDKEFISWFVDQRNRSRPKGKFVFIAELLRLGVSKDLIDDFFNQSVQDEDGLAAQALSKRWPLWSNIPKEKRFQKAYSFLLRRGFNFDTIRQLISKLEKM